MKHSPQANDGADQLVLVRQLWRELQTTHRDPVKYDALVKRIRNAADAFRHRSYPSKRES